MKSIIVAGADPSLKNFGMTRMCLNLGTGKLEIMDLKLVQTDKRTGKVVRANSDDLRRAQELTRSFHEFLKGSAVLFAEVPSGAQSARAALSFGLAIGILAGSPIPLIQVQPSETKLAAVGTKTASKEEMIEWAAETYPDAPWIRHKSKGQMVLTGKNEHLADAVAVVHAGVRTDQFLQLLSMWKAGAELAA